jgi:hypothetical protein
MRTKTLILTAALGLVGIATSVAQVYSVNAVGYVNLTIGGGFSIIANPLDAGTGNNTVGKLLPTVPDGVTLFKYGNATGTYTSNIQDGGWSDENMTLNPGEGVFIKNPGAALTVTFVGEVPQGTASNFDNLPAGLQIIASKVPQAGKLEADLKFVGADGDIVFRWETATQGYKSFIYDGGWGEDPVINVGQGFFLKKAAAGPWTRNFSVNQ